MRARFALARVAFSFTVAILVTSCSGASTSGPPAPAALPASNEAAISMPRGRSTPAPGTSRVGAAVVAADVGISSADPGSESLLTGTYRLSFTGEATVTIPIGSGSVDGYAYAAATNESAALVTFTDSGAGADETLYLSFTNTKRTASAATDTGVTNVRLIRPHLAPNGMRWWSSASQTFTDPFLATLSGYSTLRFMDWTATNGSPVVNWADRTPGSYATAQRQVAYNGGYQPTGASWEDAIALANATNEVNLAESEASSNPAYKATCSPSDRCRWGQCRVAERLMQIANDFGNVYGHAAINATVRPVFATQEDQTYDLGGALASIAATYGPPSSFFYGVAKAPYWQGDQSVDGKDGRARTLRRRDESPSDGAVQHGTLRRLCRRIRTA